MAKDDVNFITRNSILSLIFGLCPKLVFNVFIKTNLDTKFLILYKFRTIGGSLTILELKINFLLVKRLNMLFFPPKF